MDYMDYEALNYALRVLGRLGFVLLLIALYKLYRVLASPLVKERNRTKVIIFAVSIIASIGFLMVNYFTPYPWWTSASMAFSNLTIYALALYLYRQSEVLEEHSMTPEFQALMDTMDNLISSLKK